MRWHHTAAVLALLCALAPSATAGDAKQDDPFADLPEQGESKASNAFEHAKDSIGVVTVRAPDGSRISQGSGVLVKPGVMATNWHVVAGGASITVRAGDVENRASIIRATKEPDLALLKVDPDFLTPIDFHKVRPSTGDEAYAIGAPEGLELTLSDGIVSAVRDLRGTRLLQTTANIAPGSTGGALVDMSGHLLGITTSRVTGERGLNFAITPTHVRDLLDAEHDRTPTAETRHSSMPPLSGLYAIGGSLDGKGGILRLLDPGSLFTSEGRIAATLFERWCLIEESGTCKPARMRKRVVTNCVSERAAILQWKVDSYRQQIDGRTLIDTSMDNAEWSGWGAGEKTSISKRLGRTLCELAKLPEQKRKPFLAEFHDRVIKQASCRLFRQDELFEFEVADNAGNTIMRGSQFLDICR